MNLGVILQSELTSGGGFQYELRIALEVSKIDLCNVKFFTLHKNTYEILSSYGLDVILIKKSFIDKSIRNRNIRLGNRLKLLSSFERELEKHQIDLVYFLSPSGLSLDLMKHNYIITVWDLCHRDHPEFPEVNHFREFERREYLYSNSLKKATAIITDSEITREKIVSWYGVDKKRIYIIPFLPTIQSSLNNVVEIKEKYNIQGDYIFYPAQFWPHKNHIYILDALKVLKTMGENIFAVFSGADKGNLLHVMEYAKKIGVYDRLKYLGFVPMEDIYSLYKNALALVMPTYFGPTNLPILEAFEIGTPVIYSGLKEFEEEVKDAALFVDLSEPRSLAEAIVILKRDVHSRNKLIEKGKQLIESIKNKNHVKEVLTQIIKNYQTKRKLWK